MTSVVSTVLTCTSTGRSIVEFLIAYMRRRDPLQIHPADGGCSRLAPAHHHRRQLGPGLHPELGEHVLQMGLHRRPTHQQVLGDLGVGLPLGDEFGNLQLGRREALPTVSWTLAASTSPGRVRRGLAPFERILLERSSQGGERSHPSRLDTLALEAEAPSIARLIAKPVGGGEQPEAIGPALAVALQPRRDPPARRRRSDVAPSQPPARVPRASGRRRRLTAPSMTARTARPNGVGGAWARTTASARSGSPASIASRQTNHIEPFIHSMVSRCGVAGARPSLRQAHEAARVPAPARTFDPGRLGSRRCATRTAIWSASTSIANRPIEPNSHTPLLTVSAERLSANSVASATPRASSPTSRAACASLLYTSCSKAAASFGVGNSARFGEVHHGRAAGSSLVNSRL